MRPVDPRRPPEGDHRDLPFLPGSKRTAVPAGIAEAFTPGSRTVKAKSRVHLEEVGMGADLHRTIAAVADPDGGGPPPGVGHDRLTLQEDLPGHPFARGGDRLVDGDQLGAVREGRFDLDVVKHRRHPRHDIVGVEDLLAV